MFHYGKEVLVRFVVLNARQGLCGQLRKLGSGGKICKEHVHVSCSFHRPNYWLKNSEGTIFIPWLTSAQIPAYSKRIQPCKYNWTYSPQPNSVQIHIPLYVMLKVIQNVLKIPNISATTDFPDLTNWWRKALSTQVNQQVSCHYEWDPEFLWGDHRALQPAGSSPVASKWFSDHEEQILLIWWNLFIFNCKEVTKHWASVR